MSHSDEPPALCPGGTQVPQHVIDAISDYLAVNNANSGGAYQTSRNTDRMIAEARAAMGTYTSYWGSFAVNDVTSVVTHQTFGALNTAMSGTNQVRGFTMSGNRLTLRPPVTATGNQSSLTWERVPDLPQHSHGRVGVPTLG